MLRHAAVLLPDEPVFLSSITAAELVQGIYQGSVAAAKGREVFVREIPDNVAILPFLSSTAWVAGKIRGEQAGAGNTLPLADSLIAATALESGLAVLTYNLADFRRIPDLRVVPFRST